MNLANLFVLMNENGPLPGFSMSQSQALRKKLRSLKWKPESVMRETVLIQRLREMVPVGDEL
jgi:hypothetical protein